MGIERRSLERLSRVISAKVPRSFLEAGFREELQRIRKELEQDGADVPDEIKGKLKEYLKEYVHGIPPDINGRRWSYAGAQELIAEYWEKIKQYAKKYPEYRKKLESLLMEDIDEIYFKSNYEVSLVVSLKSDPFSLRSTKLPLLATLLKVGLDLGDIGKKKKEGANVLRRVLNWYLSNVEIVDTETLYNTILEALKQEQGGAT